MGRPKKPTNLKKLQGNPGKRKLNKNEPQPDIKIPSIPDHLNDIAKSEWCRIAPILERMGLLSDLDSTALAAYCQCYARWKEAEAMVESEGMTITTTKGNIIQSPYLGIANKAMTQMHKFLCQFGMTPAARSSVTSNKKEAPGKLDKFKQK